MTTTTIVIPARRQSTRFPNKPLAQILGRSLIHRVWSIARAVPEVDDVVIATDDEGIAEAAREFGARVVMTWPGCKNGSERVFDAVQQGKNRPGIIVNLQGDAVLTPPWVIHSVIREMKTNAEVSLATPAVALSWLQMQGFIRSRLGDAPNSSGTMVVFDQNKNALYFSKAPIPFVRDQTEIQTGPFFQHIGLYAYRYETLAHYVSLPISALERIENLEQLRALENGIPIRIVMVDYRGRTHSSIDDPKDISRVENLIRKEGELLEWT